MKSANSKRRKLKKRARDAFDRMQEQDPRLTQAGLARELGLSRATVSKTLNCETATIMTIEFAVGLSEYINLSLDEIFGVPKK